MATGVKPRDDENQLTRADLDVIQDALKCKKFREMLTEYCDEIRDPANQAIYQKEMTQLEKERGYDITFINPKGGYVIKTSVAGDRKAFINICSNENIGKPSYKVEEVNGQKGMNWQIPYSLIPPREDFDHKKERCVIYDVVFHPETLRMAEVNNRFRDLVNKTAFDGLQNTYNIHLDSNNCRFPKSYYKGMSSAAVIRKEDPNYTPLTGEDDEELTPELIEKLYPQQIYSQPMDKPQKEVKENLRDRNKDNKSQSRYELTHSSENGYTVPKYIIKQQKKVDIQDYTYHKDSKQHSAIPSHLVVEINLPLISSTKDCVLDVNEKSLLLVSEKPAKYKLNLTLPYTVNDKNGNAKFDKSKHMLIVTLPVIKKTANENSLLFKVDSGVESEEYSGSQSEEDNIKEKGIVELNSSLEACNSNSENMNHTLSNEEPFLLTSMGYILPSYTSNVLDEIIAFTFHVKNTEPDSVQVKCDGNEIFIKFTSVGSGFVPVHYAAIIAFQENVKFKNVTGEAWDNNVILQLELADITPHSFCIGLNKQSMTTDYIDVSQHKISLKEESTSNGTANLQDNEELPVVEVTNLGSETNIVVSSSLKNDDDSEEFIKKNEIVWTDNGTCESGAKGILRKSMPMIYSFSESSFGDVASSMDYISSDCIPEESSLKKTVRFNDVIAKQFYRYNSSIEGQKKKNQRKKSKKRNQERHRSESEAEEETVISTKTSKHRLKSVLKQRRDSGLADTSDAEVEFKTVQSDSEQIYNNNGPESMRKTEDVINEDKNSSSTLKTMDYNRNSSKKNEFKLKTMPNKHSEQVNCDNVIHNTILYDPDKLNKGQYTEVSFKNDLIFDLDM